MRGESTTLPLGWERVDDADDGVFYFQQSTGTSSWTRPENAALGASAASPKQPSQPALPSTASSQVPPVAAAAAAGDALVAAVSFAYVDDASVEAMLSSGRHHPAQRDGSGSTALHAAARVAYFSGIALLVQFGGDLGAAASGTGETPLHAACHAGEYAASCAGYLISLGADVATADAQGLTALHVAAALGNATCASELLRLGASAGAKSARGDTPLHIACAASRTECVRVLLQGGAAQYVDAPNQYGRTPRSLGLASPDVSVLFGASSERSGVSGDRSHLISSDSSSGDDELTARVGGGGGSSADGAGSGASSGAATAQQTQSQSQSQPQPRKPPINAAAATLIGDVDVGAPLSRMSSPSSVSPNSNSSWSTTTSAVSSASSSLRKGSSGGSGGGGGVQRIARSAVGPSLFGAPTTTSTSTSASALMALSSQQRSSSNDDRLGYELGRTPSPGESPEREQVQSGGGGGGSGSSGGGGLAAELAERDATIARLREQHERDQLKLRQWQSEVLAYKEEILKQREVVIELKEQGHSVERQLWHAQREATAATAEVEQLRAAQQQLALMGGAAAPGSPHGFGSARAEWAAQIEAEGAHLAETQRQLDGVIAVLRHDAGQAPGPQPQPQPQPQPHPEAYHNYAVAAVSSAATTELVPTAAAEYASVAEGAGGGVESEIYSSAIVEQAQAAERPEQSAATVNKSMAIWDRAFSNAKQNADAKQSARDEMFAAARRGDAEAVERLLLAGTSVQLTSRKGQTLMHSAAKAEEGGVLISLLCNYNADVDAVDAKGMCALHFAAARGNESCVRQLLQNGATADLPCKKGNTPLHLAAITGQLGCAELLLEYGADPAAHNADGDLAAELASDPTMRARLVAVARVAKKRRRQARQQQERALSKKRSPMGSQKSAASPSGRRGRSAMRSSLRSGRSPKASPKGLGGEWRDDDDMSDLRLGGGDTGGRTTDAETAFGSDTGEDGEFGDAEYDEEETSFDEGGVFREEDEEGDLAPIEERMLLQQQQQPNFDRELEEEGNEREYNDGDYATGFESAGGPGGGGASSSAFADSTDGTNRFSDMEDEEEEDSSPELDGDADGVAAEANGAGSGSSAADGSGGSGSGGNGGGEAAAAGKGGSWLGSISGYFFGAEAKPEPKEEAAFEAAPPSDTQLGGVTEPAVSTAARRRSSISKPLRARYVPTTADFGEP